MADSAEHNAPHESHGHSTAAWTGVGIMLLGSLLISLGLVLSMPFLWILGVLVFAGGAIAWIVMSKAGYGDGGAKNKMGH